MHRLVRYVAQNEQLHALEFGDYVEQFWCTTTLAGLSLIEKEGPAALRRIEEACAIPAATSFQLQTLRDRLQLLVELDVQAELIEQALAEVEKTLLAKTNRCDCQRVVLWHGDGLHTSGASPGGAKEAGAENLVRQIRSALNEWQVGADVLAICGGMTESDVVFAEASLQQGARVRIMLRDPAGCEGKSATPWPPLASTTWQERLHRLRLHDNPRKEIWIDTDHLGPVQVGARSPVEISTGRHKQWLLNTAMMEASQPFRRGDASSTTTTLYGLFFTNGNPTSKGAWYEFVREVERFDGYQGEVRRIR